jgi:GST-like protein|tara:strand:+ start:440 stop:1108 length:669 start_codon:yes stop_codon:yes gene_type:complete
MLAADFRYLRGEMIDLYTWATPNGRKVSIMLEELGLDYNVHQINITKGEQHTPEFMAISPNNMIPGIVDSGGPGGEPFPMFETGAILIYLAEKTESELYPKDFKKRMVTLQWLMWQMGGVGPTFGQAHHFMFNPSEVVPYGQERYHKEAKRLYKVMNTRMQDNRYLAGGDYSVADIATFPWVDRFRRHQVDLAEFPNVKRWHEELWERPAVKKGMEVPFYNQ